MDTLTIAGILLVLLYIPLVILVYSFLAAFRKGDKKHLGLFFSLVFALFAPLCFIVAVYDMALLYSAIQDGVIGCYQKRNALACRVTYTAADDALEYWSLMMVRYGSSILFFSLALCSLDIVFKNFRRQS